MHAVLVQLICNFKCIDLGKIRSAIKLLVHIFRGVTAVTACNSAHLPDIMVKLLACVTQMMPDIELISDNVVCVMINVLAEQACAQQHRPANE